jgi:serine/threonine-protein kinase
VAEHSPTAELTLEQRKLLEERLNLRLIERFRRSVFPGVVASVIIGAACRWRFPELSLFRQVGPPAAIGLIVASALPLSYIPLLKRRFGLVAVLFASAIVVIQGVHVAITGGFDSPLAPTPFIVWAVGSVATPLSFRILVPTYLCHLGMFVGLQYAIAPHPGSPFLFIGIAIAIVTFNIYGSYMRDRAETELFLAHDRLAELNASLEGRVREQVHEIVSRAREVDVLNAELRERVQERSRELAEALRRLSGRSLDERDLRAGDLIGDRVTVVRLLGRGGMGAVYLGDDRVTGGRVAVKLMHPSIATDAKALQRFLAEATAASAIAHPGIVKTLHVDVAGDGRLYQIMEYVDGTVLSRALERGKLPTPQVARIGAEIARALAAAHRAGVIHRDIKPANLVLCPSAPGVRILDFGLSKVIEHERDRSATGLTRTQDLMGTPAYMSPEQIRDVSRVNNATDIYSLGAVLYEMIGGQRLFGVDGPALYVAHLADEPRPLAELASDAPRALVELIHRCLAKSPDQRPTANDLVFHLTHLADELGAPPAEAIGALPMDSTIAGSA